MDVLLALVLMALFLYGAFRLSRHMLQAREDKMLDAALQLGFSFGASGEALEALPIVRLPLFQGHSRRTFSNVLRGKVGGREVVLFDYHGSNVHARGSTLHTLACFQLPDVALPEFSLQVGSPLHSFGLRAFTGYRDINFEDKKAFSQTYMLFGPDEASVRELFGRGPADFFNQNFYWRAEGGGDWLVLGYSKREVGGGYLDPAELPEFLQKVGQIADMFADGPSGSVATVATAPSPSGERPLPLEMPSGSAVPPLASQQEVAGGPSTTPPTAAPRPAPPRRDPRPTFPSKKGAHREVARLAGPVFDWAIFLRRWYKMGLILTAVLLFLASALGRACG